MKSRATKKPENILMLYLWVQGWKIALEPTTFGTTIRRSNLLSYIHHLLLRCKDKEKL